MYIFFFIYHPNLQSFLFYYCVCDTWCSESFMSTNCATIQIFLKNALLKAASIPLSDNKQGKLFAQHFYPRYKTLVVYDLGTEIQIIHNKRCLNPAMTKHRHIPFFGLYQIYTLPVIR